MPPKRSTIGLFLLGLLCGLSAVGCGENANDLAAEQEGLYVETADILEAVTDPASAMAAQTKLDALQPKCDDVQKRMDALNLTEEELSRYLGSMDTRNNDRANRMLKLSIKVNMHMLKLPKFPSFRPAGQPKPMMPGMPMSQSRTARDSGERC